MNFYEVIHWGNDSDDAAIGAADGPDTCFLIRARSPEEAAALADARLAEMPHEGAKLWAEVIYLLGTEAGTEEDSRILREPYVQQAIPHGWKCWRRDSPGAPWIAQEP